MSTALATNEDFKFFDFLAPYRWPTAPAAKVLAYRELVTHGDLQIETVLENALAVTARGSYSRVALVDRDFCDGNDAKKSISQWRNNNIARNQWTNSAAISSLKNKRGLIRALVYSVYADRFYFFAIPYSAYQGMYQVDILMDSSVGQCEPQGIPRGKWTAYSVGSFEQLATITEQQAEFLPQLHRHRAVQAHIMSI